MKTKSNSKLTIFIFQICAVIFLLLGLIGRILLNQDYDLLFFGRPTLISSCMICFLLFYLIEFLVIALLFIKTNKASFFLTYIVLIPLILIHIYFMIISSSSDVSIEKNHYPEFDTTIIIENGDDLFGYYSRIYETKNNILLKKLAVVDGGLSFESSYDVEIKNNKIIYTYEDDFDENIKNQLILEYENGHFKEVTD